MVPSLSSSSQISFNSTIKLVSFNKSQVVTLNDEFVYSFRNDDYGSRSRRDNTVGRPHGFIINWIEIFKNIKKVTEIVDVKNGTGQYTLGSRGASRCTTECATESRRRWISEQMIENGYDDYFGIVYDYKDCDDDSHTRSIMFLRSTLDFEYFSPERRVRGGGQTKLNVWVKWSLEGQWESTYVVVHRYSNVSDSRRVTLLVSGKIGWFSCFVHYRGRAHGMPKNIACCFELEGTPIIDVWLSIQRTLSHVTTLSRMASPWDRSIAGQVFVGPHIAFSRSCIVTSSP
ncbi:hypothetical protein Tco_0390089 [Tanacetum coccineum]